MVTVLVFLLNLSTVVRTSTFIAAFQTSGHWSKNEYLEYKNNIPELTEFTSCHWERASFFSERSNEIWTYCQYKSVNETNLRCVSIYYYPPNPNGKIVFGFNIPDWINDRERITWKFENIEYKHRQWNHFCLVYSNPVGTVKLYHNGELFNNISILDDSWTHAPAMPDSRNAYDAALIVGQDPDVMRGKFDKHQSFAGDIAELNIYTGILNEEVIRKLARCTYSKEVISLLGVQTVSM